MFRVLVTACLGPAGTSVMMLLDAAIFERGLSDLEVIGVDAASGKIPLATAPDYLDKVMALAAGCDLIIPGCDEEALLLADDSRSVCQPLSVVLLTRDKVALYTWLQGSIRRIGGDVPAYLVGAFVKQRASRGGAGAYRLGWNWMACEHLPGEEYSVDLLRWRGVIRSTVVRRREAVVRGVATAGTVLADDQITALANHVATELQYEGPMNVQFKRRADGTPVLIDVNARFGGGVSISAAAGINLPELLVRLARGEDIAAPVPKPGRYVSTVERRPKQ